MHQKIETCVIPEEKERTITIKCPKCGAVNTVLAEEDVDAQSMEVCWNCRALFSYKEYYE